MTDRRVIFPPTETWTRNADPKESSVTNNDAADCNDDPEDRPLSFTLGHDLTRLVLAAFQRNGVGESTAFIDIEAHHPGVTLLQSLPAILEALHVLGEGTPLVANGGIDVLREQLAQTYLHAEAGRTQEDDQ